LLIQRALREIVTKIASNPLVKTRYRSSVWPDFIGEMTRVGTNQGVSRQKLATFRRKIGGLGRVVKGAQQRKTRRERPAGVLHSLMVRAGGFTGQPAFPLRGRC
jgi:hypothetical protein